MVNWFSKFYQFYQPFYKMIISEILHFISVPYVQFLLNFISVLLSLAFLVGFVVKILSLHSEISLSFSKNVFSKNELFHQRRDKLFTSANGTVTYPQGGSDD